MSTLEQRCFATSAVAHAAVVGLLAAASLVPAFLLQVDSLGLKFFCVG